MPYRFELAKSGRAGCQTKECKDEGLKIEKGTLRIGTWIENESRQFWMWRHWGCLTPKVIENMTNGIRSEENPDSLQFDMLDGWEELGDEEQAKITRALTKGHVEDEEWNGDIECNRPGGVGMRLKGKKAAEKAAREAEGAEKAEAGVSSSSKKRDLSEAEGVADDEEPAKKRRGPGRPKKTQEDGSATAHPAKKAGRPKKVVEEVDSDSAMPDADEASEEEDSPKKKSASRATRARATPVSKAKSATKATNGNNSKGGRKAAATKVTEEVAQDEVTESPEERPKRGRKAKTANKTDEEEESAEAVESPEPKPTRGRKAKATSKAAEVESTQNAKEKPKAGRGRKAKVVEEPAQDEDDEVSDEKPKGKPGRKPTAKTTKESLEDEGVKSPKEKRKPGPKAKAAAKTVEAEESAEVKDSPEKKASRARKPTVKTASKTANKTAGEKADKPNDGVSQDQLHVQNEKTAENESAEPVAPSADPIVKESTHTSDKPVENIAADSEKSAQSTDEPNKSKPTAEIIETAPVETTVTQADTFDAN